MQHCESNAKLLTQQGLPHINRTITLPSKMKQSILYSTTAQHQSARVHVAQ